MEDIIIKLRIQTLKAQLALSQIVCGSITNELKVTALTEEQRAVLYHRREKTLREGHFYQTMSELVERLNEASDCSQ